MEYKSTRPLFPPGIINHNTSRSYGISTAVKNPKPGPVTPNNFIVCHSSNINMLKTSPYPEKKMVGVYDRSGGSLPLAVGPQKNLHKQKYFNKNIDDSFGSKAAYSPPPNILHTVYNNRNDYSLKPSFDRNQTVNRIVAKIDSFNSKPADVECDQVDTVAVDDSAAKDMSKKPSRFLGKNRRKKDKGKGKKSKDAESNTNPIARCEDKLECLKKYLEKRNSLIPNDSAEITSEAASKHNVLDEDSTICETICNDAVILNSNSENHLTNLDNKPDGRSMFTFCDENPNAIVAQCAQSNINKSDTLENNSAKAITSDSSHTSAHELVSNILPENHPPSTNNETHIVNDIITVQASVDNACIKNNSVTTSVIDLNHFRDDNLSPTVLDVNPASNLTDIAKTDASQAVDLKPAESEETMLSKVVANCQDSVTRLKEFLSKKKRKSSDQQSEQLNGGTSSTKNDQNNVERLLLSDESEGKFSSESSGYETSDDDLTFQPNKNDFSRVSVDDESDGDIPDCRISECDSEDSFIVFESDPNDCVSKVNIQNIVETSDDDSDNDEGETLLKCEDSDAECDSDYCTSELNSVEYVSTLKSCMKKPRSRRSPAKLAQVSTNDLKVSFSPAPPKVHKIIAWKHAYHMARIGHWQNYARDTERFKQRITNTSLSLDWVLKREHRSKVFFQRFRPIIMRQKREEQAIKAQERREAKEREIQAEKEKEMLRIDDDLSEEMAELVTEENKMVVNESLPQQKDDESVLVKTDTLNYDNSNTT